MDISGKTTVFPSCDLKSGGISGLMALYIWKLFFFLPEIYSRPLFSLNLGDLHYCYTHKHRSLICYYSCLRQRWQFYLLYRRAKGVIYGPHLRIHMLEQLSLFNLQEGWDGLDPPLSPHAVSQEGKGSCLGSAVQHPEESQDSRFYKVRGPVSWSPIFAQPLIQCCQLHIPSLVTWRSLESGSGYTEVNKQSQLRSINVLMEEVQSVMWTPWSKDRAGASEACSNWTCWLTVLSAVRSLSAWPQVL